MAERVKPLISRVGGKSRMAGKIADIIMQHKFSIFTEPFCGSAAIYFELLNRNVPQLVRSRGHHFRAVLNDADKSLIDLYKVVRDNPAWLAYLVYFTPYSRAEHKAAQQKRGEVDRVEEARSELVDVYQSFKANPGDSWAVNLRTQLTPDCGLATRGSPVFWNTLPDRILAAAEHLGEPQIEEARLQLVKLWQAFTKLERTNAAGNGNVPWGASTEGGEAAQWHSLIDRIFAITPHLQQPRQPMFGCLRQVDRVQAEEARSTLVENWQSYATDPNQWQMATQTQCHGGGVKDHAQAWSGSPDRLLSAAYHLKSVYLECDDAIKVAERWDTTNSLIYLDPPYVGCEDYYAHNAKQTDADHLALHKRLAEFCNTCEGQPIVSYYPNELLDDLYPVEKWDRFYFDAVASSAGITRNSKTKTRPKRTEMLLVRKSDRLQNLHGQMNLFA